MVLDPTSQSALVIIAVAVSIQAFLFVAMVIAGVMAWRRAQGTAVGRAPSSR